MKSPHLNECVSTFKNTPAIFKWCYDSQCIICYFSGLHECIIYIVITVAFSQLLLECERKKLCAFLKTVRK